MWTIANGKHQITLYRLVLRSRRNFYKGLLGDAINVMLAAAAFNFKRAMRFLLRLIRTMIKWSIQGVDSNVNETKVLSNTICWL